MFSFLCGRLCTCMCTCKTVWRHYLFCHGHSLPLLELLLSSKIRFPVLFPHSSLLHCTASPTCYPTWNLFLPCEEWKMISPVLPQPECWVKPLNRHLYSWPRSMLLKKTRVWCPAPQYKFTKSMTPGTLLEWWPASQISTTTQNGWKQALNVTLQPSTVYYSYSN